VRAALGLDPGANSAIARCGGVVLTFLAVVVAWVFFRAADLSAAVAMLRAMTGANGVALPSAVAAAWPEALVHALAAAGIRFETLPAISDASLALVWIASLWAVVWLLPNSQQILARFRPALNRVRRARLNWRPDWGWLAVTASGLFYAISQIGTVSEFLYFQF
jgi:hypothetical protein